MSRFVQRNKTGTITGSFARMQPGYAEEEVANDDRALVAFETRLDDAAPPRDLAAELDALTARIDVIDAKVDATIAPVGGLNVK